MSQHPPDNERPAGDEHGDGIPRNARGGMPTAVVIIAIVIFVVLFFLIREVRGNFVDYSSGFGAAEAGLVVPALVRVNLAAPLCDI
ncbi:hypothetical protein [Nesterenkonia alba]|uniref:hypothetical protein n=1 Tax=Nesterenkonia alba TaxID=515814 RepID=UPI0003B3B16F|nr:hypothetical protein [Nesterenkonia alba]